MELKKIKKYALDARKTFKLAVTKQLNLIDKSQLVIDKINELGEDEVIEQAAYTWFNRLCAIRYLELNEKLPHGFRVLSHPLQPSGFEIIEHLEDLTEDFGLDKSKVVDLKLDGNNDEELYKMALLGQCEHLAQGFSFLFGNNTKWVNDLLPTNLTRTQSIVRSIVDGLDELYWQSLDVFSELFSAYYGNIKKELPKKIGVNELAKVTQVTEPKWVSQYMVENSLARRWLELSPESNISDSLAYFLPDVAQPDDIKSHIVNISTSGNADPRELKVLDASCGSGRNLLLAYDLLVNIYIEKGYRLRDIPQEIFEHNIVGFDIDERAIQVSSLILVLQSANQDRRFLTRGYQPNILDLSNMNGLGSIVSLGNINNACDDPATKSAIKQAFNQSYDVIVTYPPNLGILGAGDSLLPLKEIAKAGYPETKSNLATMFFSRTLSLLKPDGFTALILKDSWLFMARYEKMRGILFNQHAITSLAHLGRGVIPDQHQMNAVVIRNSHLPDFEARYCYTTNADTIDRQIDASSELQEEIFILPKPVSFPIDNERNVSNSLAKMSIVPTKPLSYWASSGLQKAFSIGKPFKMSVTTLSVGKNIDRDLFVRQWWEINHQDVDAEQGNWKPVISGGEYRRWYGNINGYVNTADPTINGLNQVLLHNTNSWTALSPKFNAREVPSGAISDPSGPCFAPSAAVKDEHTRLFQLGLLNSTVFDQLIKTVYPEGVLGSIRANDLAILPIADENKTIIADITAQLVECSKQDWHSVETSTGFNNHPLMIEHIKSQSTLIENDFIELKSLICQFTSQSAELERTLNRRVNESYQIADIEIPEVPLSELSFNQNPYMHTGVDSVEGITEEQKSQVFNDFQSNTAVSLLSYIMGCIMGRYSYSHAGVVFAEQSNSEFKSMLANCTYTEFQPDEDAIVPLAEDSWLFEDDATGRVIEFIKLIWANENSIENIRFIAESLVLNAIKPKKAESAENTIRRYLSTQFFKDHMSCYSRKPIYWLFSSGKEKAFECLVYLHRYNEGTLPRLRTEYVIPLMGKYEAQQQLLVDQKIEASNVGSSAEVRRIEKELKTLEKKQAELHTFDEQLKQYAEMRITLDLDDGVKANYGKFGNLLADVKAIHGKAVK